MCPLSHNRSSYRRRPYVKLTVQEAATLDSCIAGTLDNIRNNYKSNYKSNESSVWYG